MRFRRWSYEEVAGRDSNEVIRQSDQLEAKLGEILFGKHPGAQYLALVSVVATWITNHQSLQVQEHALDSFDEALRECVELKR